MNLFKHFVPYVKHRSNATLRAWSYQLESILAQRSRRVQQLFSFYNRMYGANGMRQLLRHYHKRLQPPIRGIMMSAVGLVGLGIHETAGGGGFNWSEERLSLKNFDTCRRDLEFIETLPNNKLCPKCKEKQMKYCYCILGNKKCKNPSTGQETIRACRQPLKLKTEIDLEGKQIIEGADESIWEPYFSKDEFLIWRREERTAMYAYKVYASFDDVSANDLLQVQTDLNYRRQWDESAVKLEVIEEDPLPEANSHLIYWEMQWPKLFSNRDYVYCRRFISDYGRKVIMICNRGTRHDKYPVHPSKVRVESYWSFMVIKPYGNLEEPGVHFILTYYDDPGLPIPQSIKSWVTQKQMPDFLRKMYAATKQYSCKDALEMQKILNFTNFTISNNEYSANVARSSWLSKLWKQRDAGK